jgi:hypothetical protein
VVWTQKLLSAFKESKRQVLCLLKLPLVEIYGGEIPKYFECVVVVWAQKLLSASKELNVHVLGLLKLPLVEICAGHRM